MAHIILVQFLIWLPLSLGAADSFLPDADLGEKRIKEYKERYFPDIIFDHYMGSLKTSDQLYWDNYLNKYIFPEEKDFNFYLKNELNAGMICTDESLASKIDYIRFSYRLIALSYLIEGQWHMKMVSNKLGFKNNCNFNLEAWIKKCTPRGLEMNKFISKLAKYRPTYDEDLPVNYKKHTWFQELTDKKFKYYSHYRIHQECKDCKEDKVNDAFSAACSKDQELMTQICSENDELYGLAGSRDAYSLLSSSNIINTFNQKGDAVACLRRFSEIMRHKEAGYLVFKDLFNVMRTHLKKNYGERFSQGRVFFYGAVKEFEQKGLKNIFIEPQRFVISELLNDEMESPKVTNTNVPELVIKQESKITPIIKSQENEQPVFEIPKQQKSAFLQASDALRQTSLNRMAVDMQKLKYDHVFTLNMIHNLSSRLVIFMGREALLEMKKFDKLGTRQSPVPLLFIKYMIDMEEHKGLWNLVNILGDKFYVSNQIDETYKPEPELVQLSNSEFSGQWQIYILRKSF